jgi:hypothetical protein
MNWEIIFKDAVPSLAGVIVYDKKANDVLGRYVIAKTMKTAKGGTLTTQTYRSQRPAALRFARKFLSTRATKAGVEYVPGSGAGTAMFKPVNA